MSNQESPISSPQSLVPSPQYLIGNRHEDERGIITFNNDFDASQIKRIYTIENHSTELIRGWQGHKIEQRWLACIRGSFEVRTIQIDDFENPSRDLPISKFILEDKELTYLHIPAGYTTAIKSLEPKSKLLVLADYAFGEIKDEYRYTIDYFCKT